jgi:amino acid adenylation domain-containing protein
VTEELLHRLVDASAAARPDATAVIDRDRQLRYGELDAQANRLAHLLLDLGLARGDRVGLFIDKSADAVVAYYGALKAGAIVVPLDPHSPIVRVAHIVADAGMRFMAVGTRQLDVLSELCQRAPVLKRLVVVDGDEVEPAVAGGGATIVGRSALAGQAETPPAVTVSERDVAYVLYTSGSTGRPKGVTLSHLNALTFVDWAVEEFAVTAADRLSSHAPLHFDLSVFDLFAASKAGASVALVPAELVPFPVEVAAFMEQRQISVWYSVPSALSMLVTHGNLGARRLPDLRTVLFAGEVFPTKYLVRLMDLLPHRRFCNLYGPTETNVCTWYDVPALPASATAPIPIGRPIDGVEAHAVGKDDRVVAPGEVGELCVRGPSVMQGYWGDAERTAEAMRPIKHTPSEWPTYRTGDLVRLGDGGDYVFLGRRDAQNKRRGYRIELGEIETAVYAHPAVVEAAIVAIPDEASTTRILAYVVARDDLRASDLTEFVLQRIPRYMLPDEVQFRPALPKTSTGKVDRRALAATSGSG